MKVAVDQVRQQFQWLLKLKLKRLLHRSKTKCWAIATSKFFKLRLRSMRFLINWTVKMFIVGIGLMKKMWLAALSSKAFHSTLISRPSQIFSKVLACANQTSHQMSKMARTLDMQSQNYSLKKKSKGRFQSLIRKKSAADGQGCLLQILNKNEI